MTFTYDGDPSNSTIEEVRFLIGDVEEETSIITDEEIQYALDQESDNIFRAVARLARGLAARFAREESIKTATYETNRGSISAKYKAIADYYGNYGLTSASFVMPSMSKSNKQTHIEDTDQEQPFFKRNMHKTPGSDPLVQEDS